jgi:hypothetical protein
VKSDTAHHRYAAFGNRSRQHFFVERPQVFNRAATATDNQYIDLAPRVGRLDHRCQFRADAHALHRCRIHDHRNMRRTAQQCGQHVAQRRGLQ